MYGYNYLVIQFAPNPLKPLLPLANVVLSVPSGLSTSSFPFLTSAKYSLFSTVSITNPITNFPVKKTRWFRTGCTVFIIMFNSRVAWHNTKIMVTRAMEKMMMITTTTTTAATKLTTTIIILTINKLLLWREEKHCRNKTSGLDITTDECGAQKGARTEEKSINASYARLYVCGSESTLRRKQDYLSIIYNVIIR